MNEWVNDKHAFLTGLIPDGRNMRFVLPKGTATVGRHGDITLLHNSVSRNHAIIEFRDGDWYVKDVGSCNGTYVNNVSIQRCILKQGDILRFGNIRLKFELEGLIEEESAYCDETRTFAVTTSTGISDSNNSLSLIGRSDALKSAMKIASRAAKSDATVLICGESGTGKELFAKLVYEESNRRKHKYLAINCSAVEQTLLSSELFGHEKGAFTGAEKQKKGFFEEADGGTLFLDEIGDLSQDMQVKLLRVLQEGEFIRVGGTKPIKVDVRVIAATNKNLPNAVKEGTFREDLYYRLNVIQINLPPLRDRSGDVGDLVLHFIETIGGSARRISEEAMRALCMYNWPGNVRQLRNMMERTLILSSNDELQIDDFPDEIRTASVSADCSEEFRNKLEKSNSLPKSTTLADLELTHILSVLEECGGKKTLAAERLGISRSTLYEKLKECTSIGHSNGEECSEIGQKSPK